MSDPLVRQAGTRLDLSFTPGESLGPLELTLRTPDGAVVDLTGLSITGWAGGNSAWSVSIPTPENGVALASLGPDQTRHLPAGAEWFLTLTWWDGSVAVLLFGALSPLSAGTSGPVTVVVAPVALQVTPPVSAPARLVLIPGPPGPPGPSEPGFTYAQNNPSDTWLIAHALGRYPSVTVVDSGGSTVMGDTTYHDGNSLTLHFAAPFSGTAYLN